MLVKYNNCYAPAFRDDFFNDRVSRRYYGEGYGTVPAVNIIEENDEFIIEVAAAGLTREEFSIHLQDDILTVSAERKDPKGDKDGNYRRREFNYSKFSRKFQLGDAVEQEEIRADHHDGVLSIRLPKKKESIKPGPKSIEIK